MDRDKFSEQFNRNEQEIYDWKEFDKKVRNPSLREPSGPGLPRRPDQVLSHAERAAAVRDAMQHHVGIGSNTNSIYDFGEEHGRMAVQRMVDNYDFGEPVSVVPHHVAAAAHNRIRAWDIQQREGMD